MKNSSVALKWIVTELSRRQIPFAIVGGCAANAYGTSRPLNDIDIDVPDSAIPILAKELGTFVKFGPERCITEVFDCLILGLTHQGQEIELTGAESFKIRTLGVGEWINLPTDLTKVEFREFMGVKAPVMDRERLIAYKRLAGRDTDLIDVEELEKDITMRRSAD